MKLIKAWGEWCFKQPVVDEDRAALIVEINKLIAVYEAAKAYWEAGSILDPGDLMLKLGDAVEAVEKN